MVEIDGEHLTIEDIIQVARKSESVCLSKNGLEAVQTSHKIINQIIQSAKPVYGINTGFGIFADQVVAGKDAAKLSRNLILSHAVGTGSQLEPEIVKAAMLVRANTLAKGYSGVRVEVIQTLIDMLNKDIVPVIPSQGSLGSSGDLCPLSHLALVFTTDDNDIEEESGWAEYQGQVMSGKQAMAMANLERIVLGPKEGLAINNGATFSAAISALAAKDAQYLMKIASAAAALSMEALLGCSAAFDPRIHEVRRHPGQIIVADEIRHLIAGSTLVDSTDRVQDAYSLRCTPQVHGVARDTLEFVSSIIEREINAATDNPLIFPNGATLSGGNFHGEPVGFAMDFLGIALAEIGAISERRIYRLTDGKMNAGLPPMLVDYPEAVGLNSGMMMPQYTAAALVLENQTLASSDSVRSLPTSGGQEDHNANSMNAARHTWQIVSNVTHIIALELYVAARAIDLRLRSQSGARLGDGSRSVYEQIRAVVPYQAGDTLWNNDIALVKGIITGKSLSI